MLSGIHANIINLLVILTGLFPLISLKLVMIKRINKMAVLTQAIKLRLTMQAARILIVKNLNPTLFDNVDSYIVTPAA